MQRLFVYVHLVQRVSSGYSGAVPPGPRRYVLLWGGTDGGGLLPQTAASGNVSQPDPESFMNYPG